MEKLSIGKLYDKRVYAGFKVTDSICSITFVDWHRLNAIETLYILLLPFGIISQNKIQIF